MTAVPDQLSFELAVEARADRVAGALDRASRVMRREQTVLLGAGVVRREGALMRDARDAAVAEATARRASTPRRPVSSSGTCCR